MAASPNVHVYKASREQRLLQLVFVLWRQLTDDQRLELAPEIRDSGMGWAIPDDEHDRCLNDWLTFAEVAQELGLTPSAVRNWPDRYGIIPRRGRLKWGDVEQVMRDRARRA